MKLLGITFLFFVSINICSGQKSSNKKLFSNYEQFLKNVNKDTLILRRSKEYKCSENFMGTVSFFYKDEKLKLIEHAFKEGYYEGYIYEYYFIEEGNLLLKTTRTNITHYNTKSYQSESRSGASVEKVFELIEQRAVLNKGSEIECYIRGEGRERSESETLDFERNECSESLEEIEKKFNYLLKVEKKFLPVFHKGPACIFHMW